MVLFEVASQHASCNESALAVNKAVISSEYFAARLHVYRIAAALRDIVLHADPAGRRIDKHSCAFAVLKQILLQIGSRELSKCNRAVLLFHAAELVHFAAGH